MLSRSQPDRSASFSDASFQRLCDRRLPENTAPVNTVLLKSAYARLQSVNVAVANSPALRLKSVMREIDARRLAAAQFDSERARSGAHRGRQSHMPRSGSCAARHMRSRRCTCCVTVVELTTLEVPVAQIAAAETALGEATIDEVRVGEHGLPEAAFDRTRRCVPRARSKSSRPDDRSPTQRIAQRASSDAGIEALSAKWPCVRVASRRGNSNRLRGVEWKRAVEYSAASAELR